MAVTQQVETVETVEAPIPEPTAVIGPAAININPPAPSTMPIQVQGIVADPVNPWAIVNGQTVRVGDLVNGFRVTAIVRNAITLTGNGQTNRLGLGHH